MMLFSREPPQNVSRSRSFLNLQKLLTNGHFTRMFANYEILLRKRRFVLRFKPIDATVGLQFYQNHHQQRQMPLSL